MTTLATRLDEVFDRPGRDDTGPLLTLHGVTVSFGGVHALTDLEFEVGHRDLVALIGPNGAGKTTALNAISGIVPARGRIVFDGQVLGDLRSWQVAAAGIGRSFQDPPLVEHYTVLENVLCGAHARMRYLLAEQMFWRRRAREAEDLMSRRAQILLDFVGLGGQGDTLAGSLPFGARKLVDIVRAMVSGPRLLLLDEPSSGLDHDERTALQEILSALKHEERVAILAVEHHMDLVRAVATHVTAMQAGAAIVTGSATEVLDSEQFREAVVGTAVTDQSEEGEVS